LISNFVMNLLAKLPRVYPEVRTVPGWTQGDALPSDDRRVDYLGQALEACALQRASEGLYMSSPLQRDSVPYLCLYLLDPSIALFDRSTAAAFVARLKQQLEKSLGGRAVHEQLPVWLRCGCTDPETGSVPAPILAELARRLRLCLVVYDGRRVYDANSGAPVACLLVRDPAGGDGYKLYHPPDGPRTDAVQAKRVARALYAQHVDAGTLPGMTKASLAGVASDLGLDHAGVPKRELLASVQEALAQLRA
jgi:hypothetical protein